MPSTSHAYEVRPRKDHCGVDLISDALPFGGLWHGGPNAISNAIVYDDDRNENTAHQQATFEATRNE
jgi:hypothetical protein